MLCLYVSLSCLRILHKCCSSLEININVYFSFFAAGGLAPLSFHAIASCTACSKMWVQNGQRRWKLHTPCMHAWACKVNTRHNRCVHAFTVHGRPLVGNVCTTNNDVAKGRCTHYHASQLIYIHVSRYHGNMHQNNGSKSQGITLNAWHVILNPVDTNSVQSACT